MRVVVESDVVSFFDAAHAILSPHEVENNLLLGILLGIARGAYPRDTAWLWSVHDGAQSVGFAVRTTPMPLVLSTMSEHAARAVARMIASAGALPLDLNGPSTVTNVAVEQLVLDGVARAERGVHMRLFELRQVVPRAPASGRMRLAAAEEVARIAEMLDAFEAEAVPHEHGQRDPQQIAAMAVARGGVYVWEDQGAIVAFAAYGRQVGGGAAIGPVYTAPEVRGRGYATSLVAGLSQMLLDDGRSYTCLFTDLANPTSNHIYPRIGYQPVCDYQLWKLSPP